MRVKNIDHLNLTVADFAATVDWYRRVFGFELVERDEQDGETWGVIRCGDAMLCIYEFPAGRLEDRFALRDQGRHGIAHFGLRIADRRAWEETVSREGIEVLYEGPVTWPHSISWYIRDPTGYEIEVALWQDDTIDFDPMA